MGSQHDIPPRLPGRPATCRKAGVALALAAGVAGAIVLFVFNPAQHGFYPFCVFHRMTGLLCPGCGSLRALHELLHGHLTAALRLNFVFVLSLPIVCFFFVQDVVRRRRGKRPWSIPSAAMWACLVLVLVFGVLRNMPAVRASAFAF